MTRYARIADGLVAEIVTLTDGVTPDDAFHPDLVFVPATSSASVGMAWDGKAFAAPPFPAPQPPSADESRAECARRIVALASETTQMNLNAYINLLNSKPTKTAAEQADLAAFAQAVQWIAAMRATWKQLVASGETAWRDDAKWPACPQAAQDLAARF